MTTWNKLLASLDATFGFPTRISSTVKKLQQGFDNKKQEHVIWIEYRVKVKSGTTQNQPVTKVEKASNDTCPMPFLLELLSADIR